MRSHMRQRKPGGDVHCRGLKGLMPEVPLKPITSWTTSPSRIRVYPLLSSAIIVMCTGLAYLKEIQSEVLHSRDQVGDEAMLLLAAFSTL